MKRFLLVSFAMLSFTLLGSLFVGSSVSAASDYDDVIKPEYPLWIRDNPSNVLHNITNEWGGLFASNNTWQYCTPTQMESFRNASNWAVTRVDPPGQTNSQVRVTWTEDPGDEVNFWTNGSTYKATISGSGTRHGAIIGMYNDQLTLTCGYTGGFQDIGEEPGIVGTTVKVFLSTYPVNYPQDYEGEEVPQAMPAPSDPITLTYNWRMRKDGTDQILEIDYMKNLSQWLEAGAYIDVMKCTNKEFDDCERTNPLFDFYSPISSMGYKSTEALDGAGYYLFSIEYDNSYPEDPPVEHIEKTWIRTYWDGSTLTTGTTEGCAVEVNVLCDEVGEDNETSRIFNSLNINTYGIQEFFLIPINFIETLPNYVGNCQAINIPLFGQNYPLQCLSNLYQQGWMAAIWTIWQTVVTGLVAYGVAFNVFRVIKNVNTPHNDGIEVARL